MSRPLLLGHRGSRSVRSIGENTVAAFDLALQHGCDGFEFDVRLSGDRQSLVCHDPRSKGVRVRTSRREQLPHLPTLEDVLSRYGKHGFLDIELKTPDLADVVLHDLGRHRPERGLLISSFLPEVLVTLRARDPSLPLGIIFEQQIPRWQELPIDCVVVEKSLITRPLVDQVHDAGKKLFAWTVNHKAAMLGLAKWGVDAIISDRTELLVRTLSGQSSR
jgi:glycerophosphoryl diester phosphodiesterase